MTTKLDVTTPSDREIRIVRVFDAPRELIFDCYTKPELVSRWLLGPPGWSMPVCEVDLRVGGRYRYVWRNDASGAEFGSVGEHREIAAPARLVSTERMILSGAPAASEATDGPDAAVNTLDLSEAGGRTTLTMTMRYPSQEVRDMVAKSGMSDGVGLSFDRLEALMSEIAA
jgi:uncharacterized protein YndB with AHSA1/START domain